MSNDGKNTYVRTAVHGRAYISKRVQFYISSKVISIGTAFLELKIKRKHAKQNQFQIEMTMQLFIATKLGLELTTLHSQTQSELYMMEKNEAIFLTSREALRHRGQFF